MLSINQQRSNHSWVKDILILSLGLIIFYFIGLGSYPLFTPDEGRYSEAALNMVLSQDYITPRVNGVAFLDKPILYYWLQALSIHLFGLSEWALRFFPAITGILGCIVMYICGRKLFDRRTGLLAAVILATCPLYFGGAHYANLDLEVAVFVSSAMLCFLVAIAEQTINRRFLLAAYIFAGLAFMTKGLIGVVFPAMIAGSWILLLGRWDLLKRTHIIKGLGLIALIALPWYTLVQQANPEFLHFFFVTQQVTRFLSKAEFNSQNPIWFYFPVILAGTLPWTLFAIGAIYQAIKNCWHNRFKHQKELYLLLWAILIFAFFSFPKSKLLGYIIPVIPAIALLSAHYINQKLVSKPQLKVRIVACAMLSITLLMSLIYNAEKLNPGSAKPLVAKLKQIKQPNDEIIHYYKHYYDVPLYLKQHVSIVADWDSPTIEQKDNWTRELWYGMRFQDTKDLLISEKNFWQRWNSDKRVFVLLNDNYFEQFKQGTKHYHLIAKKGDILLVSNFN